MTPRRSVSTFSADQGVGSVPYSTNRLLHGPLRQPAEQKVAKRSPRIDQLHDMSSLGPRKSSNSSGISFRKNQSHVKKWKLGKVGLACFLAPRSSSRTTTGSTATAHLQIPVLKPRVRITAIHHIPKPSQLPKLLQHITRKILILFNFLILFSRSSE